MGKNTFCGALYVGFVNIYPKEVAAALQSRYTCGSTSAEGVNYDIIGIGIELDQARGELQGKRRRMVHFLGRFGSKGPDALGIFQELIPTDGALLFPFFPAAKGEFRIHQDVLMNVPQNRIGSRPPT